ncbi:protein PET117 homolog, mitochondrial isoform X1 [Rhineura floridana]|uniref:protein PET117 homolog, mitochondrial isoform X1 n=1 Tax=Rhineura floridana TaxID=261503 RepID=UPI002AC84941|nr:protein PET117 homolog, mitochondrial isoform X1 [Rhineura floridana]
MSTTSKVVLGVSVLFSGGIVAGVHIQQKRLGESLFTGLHFQSPDHPCCLPLNLFQFVCILLKVWCPELNTVIKRLHEGVLRDLERQNRKQENLRLLEEQVALTKQLEMERSKMLIGKESQQ